jgi:hypothetical protein
VSPFLSALFAKLVPASIVGKVAAGAVAVAAVAGGGTVALAAPSSPDTATVSSDIAVTSPAPSEVPDEPADLVNTDPAQTDATPTESDDADQSLLGADPSPVEPAESTHPDNHGGDVSAVAHDTTTSGRAHGEAVSEAAHHHGDDSDAAVADDESGTEGATGATAPGNSGGHGHR